MLLSKTFANGDVLSIKLSSGEEIVGRYNDSSTDKFLLLSKPAVLSMSGHGVALIPYMVTASEGDIPFNENLIVAKKATDSEIVKQYIQSTTGIALG